MSDEENDLVQCDSIRSLIPKRVSPWYGERSSCFSSSSDAGELLPLPPFAPHALGHKHALPSSAFIDTAACNNSNSVLLTQLASAVHIANCLFPETEDTVALCGVTKKSCRFWMFAIKCTAVWGSRNMTQICLHLLSPSYIWDISIAVLAKTGLCIIL